jgi:hypothetical protein
MKRDRDADALADLARNEHEMREGLRKQKRDQRRRGRKQRAEHTKTKREHRSGARRNWPGDSNA